MQNEDLKPAINERPYLLAQFILDVPLHPAKHEWFQNHMQTAKLVLVQLATFIFCSIFDILGKPFIELVMRIEKARHNEVK